MVRTDRRHGMVGLLLAVVLAAAASVNPAPVSAGEFEPFGAVEPSIEQCFLDLHNQERTSRGLNALVPDAGLTTYAREWSLEMDRSGDFRHSDLSVPGDWRRVAENIGWSQGLGSDCTSLHQSFMSSQGHRDNILGVFYDRVGVGVAYDLAQNGIIWVTVMFGDSDGSTGPSPTPSDPAPVPSLPPTPCADATCDGFAAVDANGRWRVFDFVGDTDPLTFYFGDPGDVPFMGDWDGDGVATPGLYRQSDGYVYLRDSNTQGISDREFYFGDPGDIPLVGDWNGNGRDTVSIYRTSDARVYIINELGLDGGALGAADYSYGFGDPGDRPFSGDFDGDGIDTVGLYRQTTGFVYFRNSPTTGIADLSFFYGDPGDRIMAGDWDGDGDDTVAVYRPSNDTFYVSLNNSNGNADWDAYLGAYTNVVPGG